MRLLSHTERGDVASVNQSCLTADIWLRAVIQYLTDQKFNLNNCNTRGWYEGGMGSPLYTRHIVKYQTKDQAKSICQTSLTPK